MNQIYIDTSLYKLDMISSSNSRLSRILYSDVSDIKMTKLNSNFTAINFSNKNAGNDYQNQYETDVDGASRVEVELNDY